MKDKYDLYMQTALQPTIEPDLELNKKILAENRKGKGRRKKVLYTLAKVAAAVVILAVVAPTVVYAAEVIAGKYFITEHAISTGNQEYTSDEWLTAEEGEVAVQQLQYEEGDASVNWTSKQTECVNGYATNTYFYYDDYEKAIVDSGLDHWLNVTYETQNASYVLSETEDFTEKSVNADFAYQEGTFHISQSIMTGNVASDCAHSIVLQNTNNARTYISTSGKQFALVDEITGAGDSEVTRTYVMIAYGEYYGYLSFENLSEADIQGILETVCANMEM